MAVKNIIFDLGGVFIDIDYHKTREAFEGLGVKHFDSYYHQSHSNALFTDLEKGLITDEEFYEQLRNDTGIALSDEQIKEAWNALLGGFRTDSVAAVPRLKEQYNVYLLSNTNAIHYHAFMKIYEQQFGGEDFNRHFHQAYYSHLIKQRKPDAASYLYITDVHQLDPAETIFVDDTLKNIEGAQAVGMPVLWLQPGMLIEEELPRILG